MLDAVVSWVCLIWVSSFDLCPLTTGCDWLLSWLLHLHAVTINMYQADVEMALSTFSRIYLLSLLVMDAGTWSCALLNMQAFPRLPVPVISPPNVFSLDELCLYTALAVAWLCPSPSEAFNQMFLNSLFPPDTWNLFHRVSSSQYSPFS